MAAAVAAAESDQSLRVALLEKNDRLGKKLFLTGHGRCNVTNRSDMQNYQAHIWRNPKFVLGALNRFGPFDLEEFLARNGVRLKEEDSGRLFPVSDHSSDIIKAFRQALERAGVEIILSNSVMEIAKQGQFFQVRTSGETMRAVSVVLATGGLSYPSTGSTGEGFGMAQTAGHSLVPLQGALVGLASDLPGMSRLSGLTLRGIVLTLLADGRQLAVEAGDLLFTHHGLSGPTAFRASCYVPVDAAYPLEAQINLKPRLTVEQLERKFLDLGRGKENKEVRTLLDELIPKRLSALVAAQAELPEGLRMNQLSRTQRRRLAEAIQSLCIPVTGLRPVSEAIITGGGVPVREISPKTMESRLTAGLFFAGEMIDVSAMTGGYNLQIAFSTGWSAGQAAAAYCQREAGEADAGRGDLLWTFKDIVD